MWIALNVLGSPLCSRGFLCFSRCPLDNDEEEEEEEEGEDDDGDDDNNNNNNNNNNNTVKTGQAYPPRFY